MRAIDLYAGIGGWSLGLKLAGVEVVASYEWWQPAIDTHNGNNDGNLVPIDIRRLDVRDLPRDIDLVVGSPPCTEFSYANRGGSGNLVEGLKDLVKFLEVVDHLRPKYWALENVPRVAEVLTRGFNDPKHALFKFRHLNPEIDVVDFSEYGAAQARRRCIAGNIPFGLLRSYKDQMKPRTLGDVVNALSRPGRIVDPIWGVCLPKAQLTECQTEPPLNREELRMNRESKEFHPVYNNMAFPDPLHEPSRTVTATCTRVSRESIVIEDPLTAVAFRRLTIRERASLQGFPITYQFYARSFSEKAKMVGNAIPPPFTYLVAMAAQQVAPTDLIDFETAGSALRLPAAPALVTQPDREGRSYAAGRSFRAALPGLRFKSGMRFDLSNAVVDGSVDWKVRFFFGSSKDIREIDLDGCIRHELQRAPLIGSVLAELRGSLLKVEAELWTTDPYSLQSVWTRRAEGMSPFDLTDTLGLLAEELHSALEKNSDPAVRDYMAAYVVEVASGDQSVDEPKVPGQSKLEKYATRIISGFVIGDWFNTLAWHTKIQAAA